MKRVPAWKVLALAAAVGGSAGCPERPEPRHPVSVDVSGLLGTGLILRNNGGDDLAVDGNGIWRFSRTLRPGEPYAVTIAAQPRSPTQACTLTHDTGHAGVEGNPLAFLTCVRLPALYFVADTGDGSGARLWRTDGTAAGTDEVLAAADWDLAPNPYLSVAAGSLYFTMTSVDGFGVESPVLWKTDGSAGGTSPVLNWPDGGVVDCLGTGYFAARSVATGLELWRTDGTSSRTFQVADIQPGTYGSLPGRLTCAGSTLFFFADDGSHGVELWAFDYSPASARLVSDIKPGLETGVGAYLAPVALGDQVLFVGLGTSGNELWRSDGTWNGTARVMSTPLNPYMWKGGVLGALLVFAGSDGSGGPGSEPWATDGTEANTVPLKDINPGGSSEPGGFTAFDGAVYFRADDGVLGGELWRTDGTADGTVLVADLCPGACNSDPGFFAATPGALFFAARDELPLTGLWKTDGTANGTVRLAVPHYIESITPVGDRVFFVATDPMAGKHLWVSDGTATGTVQVPGVCPAEGCVSIHDLTAF